MKVIRKNPKPKYSSYYKIRKSVIFIEHHQKENHFIQIISNRNQSGLGLLNIGRLICRIIGVGRLFDAKFI